MRRRDKILLILGILAVVLVAFRIALPYLVKDVINRKLQALNSYDGHVEDVDLALWRGAYAIDDIKIVKTGAHNPEPFFQGERAELTIDWANLFKGSVVASGVFIKPNINLVQSKSEQEQQLGKEVDWTQTVADLVPFRINEVEVRDGTATFRAPGIRTEDALVIRKLDGVISNITNAAKSDKEAFAHFKVTGEALGNAPLHISGNVNPLTQQPTFDVDMTLEQVQLPKVNPWMREYLKADAERGNFQLYMELAAADGKFKGYAKPLMEDVKILGAQDKDDKFLHKVWEGLVEFATDIFENRSEDQVAARVPFSGNIKDPDVGILETIVSVLRNAFVGAFSHSLEGSISLRDVKESLGKYNTTEEKKSSGKKDKGDGKQKDEDRKPVQRPPGNPKF